MADFSITTEQKDEILDLQAKLKLAGNQLENLQSKMNGDVEAENVRHNNELKIIEGIYTTQITTKQTEITTLENLLKEVK